MISEEKKQQKKIEIMEKSFARYCETGLRDTGIKDLAKACGMTAPNFYSYFDNLDQLIIESTEHCMIKIENEILDAAPTTRDDIVPFIEYIFGQTRELHSKEYRFMFQVFTSPAFLESGKKFRARQYERYSVYAQDLEKVLGVSRYLILTWIISLEQAIVQYALFENEQMYVLQRRSLENMADSMLNVNPNILAQDESLKDLGF
jgi:AcrR family transcriptional regulator